MTIFGPVNLSLVLQALKVAAFERITLWLATEEAIDISTTFHGKQRPNSTWVTCTILTSCIKLLYPELTSCTFINKALLVKLKKKGVVAFLSDEVLPSSRCCEYFISQLSMVCPFG